MKKLIGLLVVIFIAGTGQVFAQEYKIGDRGPSGGFIFFDKGYSSNGWRYLEAAPGDGVLGEGILEDNRPAWSNVDRTLLGTTKTGIGKGKANTKAIIGQAGHKYSAAKVCDDLDITYGQSFNDGKSFKDYFLPSKDELNLMYENLHKSGVGGFTIGSLYWSSSENDDNHAWIQYFNSGGGQDPDRKWGFARVRCAREF
jgi:hypothetical protein